MGEHWQKTLLDDLPGRGAPQIYEKYKKQRDNTQKRFSLRSKRSFNLNVKSKMSFDLKRRGGVGLNGVS